MSELTTQFPAIDESFREYVPNVKFELIKIKNLVSNQNYQRNLSISHVNRTAENFDLYQINPVKVSRRNGINYVFNGQHTIETVAQVSGSRETPVWCMIYDDLKYEEEADIFANQMRFTKQLTPFEVFNANLEAGNEEQLTIKELVESYDLKLYHNMRQGCICAVSALESIFSKYGYHTLDQTLYLVVATWEGDAVSLSANILKGVAKLIATYGEDLRLEAFAERLSKVSPKEITRSGKERNSGALGFAEAILGYYNRRIRYPLRRDKLYSGRKRARFLEEVGMDPDEASAAMSDEEMSNDGFPDAEQDSQEESRQPTLFDM